MRCRVFPLGVGHFPGFASIVHLADFLSEKESHSQRLSHELAFVIKCRLDSLDFGGHPIMPIEMPSRHFTLDPAKIEYVSRHVADWIRIGQSSDEHIVSGEIMGKARFNRLITSSVSVAGSAASRRLFLIPLIPTWAGPIIRVA